MQQADRIYHKWAHFEQIDLTVCVVVVLQAVKRVVVSVAVDRAHGWTRGVAAVEVATVTHTGEVSNRASAEKDDSYLEQKQHLKLVPEFWKGGW